MFTFILGFIIGGAIGILVAKNNKSKVDVAVNAAKTQITAAKTVVESKLK